MDAPPIPSTHPFRQGQFKGRILRFRLELIQEPLVAKQVQWNGRRQLETLPLVRVWISQILESGREESVEERSVDTGTLLCCLSSWGSSVAGAGLETPVASREGIFGNLCVTALCLNDLENKPGLFFLFRDIAVRSEDITSFQFSLFDLNSRTLQSPDHAPILATTFSPVLLSANPSSRSGYLSSTNLDKHFLSQGYELLRRRSSSSTSTSSSDPSTGSSTPRSLSSIPMKRSFAQDSPPSELEEVALEEREDNRRECRSDEEADLISSSEEEDDDYSGSEYEGEGGHK
ncbi:hypothetical protein BDY24DRAFT_379099 [Mrakia frigida]|uniref:uncharacterized protein n=1 Tax=Mrakia frigida TaxID=29902 RepID=UPI003FCBF3E1